MKKLFFITTIINLIFLCACSGKTISQPSNASRANLTNENTVAALPDSVNPTLDGNSVPVGADDANLNANRYAKRPITNVNTDMKIPGAVEDKGVPGPFNSLVKSTMSKENKFLETRTFTNDPLLSRVEREQESKKIRVYLKNGKVVNLDYEKGEPLFMTASPNDILIAAGVKSAPTPAPQTQKSDPTKKQ